MISRTSLLLAGPQTFILHEEPIPQPAPDELLVRTCSGAVSVGTELPLYAGTHRGDEPLAYPLMTGYESLGQIIACGANVQGFAPGERILASYGHRSHALVPAQRAIRVPPTISDAVALLAILGCDTAKGVRKLRPQRDQRVVITGAGTIGLLTLFNLKAQSVAHVSVVDPEAERRQRALELGAALAVPPHAEALFAQPYDLGFECSSRRSAFAELQSIIAHSGSICILADGNLEPLELTPAFHRKELQVVGSSDGEDYPAYAEWFFQQAHPVQAQLEQLYEAKTSFQALPHLFAAIAQGRRSRPIKILVDYLDPSAAVDA
jgi:alcohol dehydrogenase